MKGGWIAVHRNEREDPLYEGGRERTKYEAWLDLIMEVNFDEETKTVLLKGDMYQCGRGQTLKSLRTWAERWGWTKNRVARFFQLLERRGLIELSPLPDKMTRLTICDYDSYSRPRDGGTADGTAADRKPGRLSPDKTKTSENERDGSGTATGTANGPDKTKIDNRQGNTGDLVDSTERPVKCRLSKEMLLEADYFSRRLDESLAPIDKRNQAAFRKLKIQMTEHAQTVNPHIYAAGTAFIRKTEENKAVKRKAAYITRCIKSQIADDIAKAAANK